MFNTLADVRAANAAIGNHFFDRGTMKFWRSRIESRLIGGRYFITSEQMPEGPRRFSIREALPSGAIDTPGDILRYENKADAREEIARLVAARKAEAGPAEITPAAPGAYETPKQFAARVVASLVDIPAVPEMEPAAPGLPGSAGSDARREFGATTEEHTRTNKGRYRVQVEAFDTGHARVWFFHVPGDSLPVIDGTALRARGAEALRAILGEKVAVHAHFNTGGTAYRVQGWRKD